MKKVITVLMLCAGMVFVTACAKDTNNIQPQYVSPMQYQSYSCKQMEAEMRMLSRRVSQIGGQVNENAESDQTAMAAGLILFWPALFFIDGNSPQSYEYARMTGEFNALEEAAIQKNCKFHVEAPKVEVTRAQEKRKSDYPQNRAR